MSSSSSFKQYMSDWWVCLHCGIDRSGPVTCLVSRKPVGDRKSGFRVDRKQTSDHSGNLDPRKH